MIHCWIVWTMQLLLAVFLIAYKFAKVFESEILIFNKQIWLCWFINSRTHDRKKIYCVCCYFFLKRFSLKFNKTNKSVSKMKKTLNSWKSWQNKISPAQSNLGRTAPQSPHWLQWDTSNSLLKLPPSHSTITTLSNTIPQPTPLTILNGIRIHSAVLPQYTLRTDGQTDRWSRRMFRHICRLRSPDRERRG